MLPTTDYQRSKVYRWENKYVRPYDTTPITVQEAQDWVDFIWFNEGRTHPPKIRTDHKKKSGADATRMNIRVTGGSLYRWIMIHELAHSFLEDGETSYGHGPVFVTKYMELLEKYLRIPMPILWYTANEAGVDKD